MCGARRQTCVRVSAFPPPPFFFVTHPPRHTVGLVSVFPRSYPTEVRAPDWTPTPTPVTSPLDFPPVELTPFFSSMNPFFRTPPCFLPGKELTFVFCRGTLSFFRAPFFRFFVLRTRREHGGMFVSPLVWATRCLPRPFAFPAWRGNLGVRCPTRGLLSPGRHLLLVSPWTPTPPFFFCVVSTAVDSVEHFFFFAPFDD